MQRREFLAGGLAVGTALAGPLVLAAPIALVTAPALAQEGERTAHLADAGAAGASLATLDRAALTRLVDADFLFYPGGRGVKLRLVRVIDATRTASPQIRQFSLLFAGGASVLRSGTYEVDAPGLARQELTIEQLGMQGREVLYRADFALL